ncbi:uncharacterized protein [Spinacia oleracea]|uniref:RING-type E3 ubiquitin transferase n=1 Tax=Spinacia oleracea TaxID=3562 RepID=A0ABM3R4Z8_SPIOL|nr:uncharacterized protein LOC130465903 [Spinacia oleracea]
MGMMSSCFSIRDHPSENSDGSDSGNYLVSKFNSIFNKVKGTFSGNEVHLTYSTKQQAASVVDAILDRTAVSVNEILIPTSSDVYQSGHQSSEQNPDETLDEASASASASASVNEGVTDQNAESGQSEAAAAAAAAAASVNTDILNTSSGHIHQNVEIGLPSEQNVEVGLITLDEAAAAAVNADFLNTSSAHIHQNVQRGEASEQSSREVVILDQLTNATLSKEEVLPAQTQLNSCTQESSLKLITKDDQVFPSSDEEDVCPTCLEDYEPDNPKIVAECSHHFHLSCIYEWMERSETCPICNRLMVINENN